MRIRGRHYRTGEQIELTCTDGKVTSVGAPTLEPIDSEAGWIAPGFFDLQVFGFGSANFDSASDGTAIGTIVEGCRALGVTALLATLRGPVHIVRAVIRRLTTIIESDSKLSARIIGYHLMGLFGDSAERMRPMIWSDFRRLQDAARGRIRLVTYAEANRSAKLLDKLIANGISVEANSADGSVGDRVNQLLATGASLADAIDHGSIRPYEIIGLPPPTIEVGGPINFLLFNLDDKKIQIQAIIVD